MIYSINSPYLAGMMDDYITGGADPYGDDCSEEEEISEYEVFESDKRADDMAV